MPFVIPEFLQNYSTEKILSEMLQKLPDNISKEENGWVCDLFYPVAIAFSRAIEFTLVEAIKNVVPKYSYGDILLGHGENRNLFLKQASYAKAMLTIQGIMGTKIPKGFAFSTVSTPEESGIVFYTVEECEIAETGIAEVECVCAEAGKKGNVAAETILLMVKPMKGIVSVVNKEKAYGGYEQETEDSFRQRIAEFDASLGNSFVGSPADYRRWALEVAGVGCAKVISAKDDTGLVTIVLTDSEGMPVQQSVCQEVENHIMRYDSWYERLAPINAYLSVVPAEPINIEVSAVVELEQGYDIEQVKQAFLKNLREYFKTEEAHTEVKYAEVGAVLIYTEGVWDYQELKVNDGVVNIEIAEYCVAVTEENSIFLYYQ